MNEDNRVTIRLSDEMKEAIEKAAELGIYHNSSEAIRSSIRKNEDIRSLMEASP